MLGMENIINVENRDILIKRYDSLYMARDLETDLRNYGETMDEAVKNLFNLIEDAENDIS
jgi:hypothetical protein